MEDPNRVVEAPDGSVWRHGKGAIEFGPDGLLHIPTSAEAIDGQFCGVNTAIGREAMTEGVHALHYEIATGSAYMVVGIASAKAIELGYNPYFGRLRPGDPDAKHLSDVELPKRTDRHAPATAVDVVVDMDQRVATFSVDGARASASIAIPSSATSMRAYVRLGMNGDAVSLAMSKK